MKKLGSLLPVRILVLLSLFPLSGLSQSQPTPTTDRPQQTEVREDRKPDPLNTGTFAGLRLRSIGPALTSGRVIAFGVDEKNPSTYFVGSASGGVWKTTNSGTTWTSVFDNEGAYSIGAVQLDPKNPLTVWVGSGENNSQRSVSYGDGIYRSDDGGKSWKNVGLKKSEHIGRIAIDPRDSNTVYVAAQGPLWGPGGDRGLYKTTDGGKTWKAVLTISENTGVTDVAIDPQSPDTLYAAAYQRRRHVFTLINGGPESAIHKSTDAGATWTKLRGGLPSVDMGRIGLALSPVNPEVIYATVEAAEDRGGIFCSTDRGATWERRNPFDVGAMYYGKIFADPKEVDRIYVMSTILQVSDDGGRTLRPLGERSKHVDNHVIWINPQNTNHYLVGCDGGVYESYDRGANWNFKANLPVTQFYDVAVDNAAPFYNIYGGTQDNYSLGGPSRTRSASGITNADWFVTLGGDGFRSQVDPEDPNIVYSCLQYGYLSRFDKRTGQRMGIQPKQGRNEPPLRYNWDTPYIISPHSHTRLYYAANKLYRSDDRGDSWRLISSELSREIDRNKLPVMGKIQSVDAVAKHESTSIYGNATALAESPKKDGLIYVGTDDGLVNVTEDGGRNWRRIDKFPGVPEMTYVSRIIASNHEANTVYAAFENHKNADFAPYLLKSTDAGRNWTAIKGNLPANGPVLAIAEDHVNANLMFAGTEFGLFFTIDGGQKWVQLRGGMPTIAVRDLAIQKRENDLVIATFGRGFYVFDDYTPLRLVTTDILAQEAHVFPVKDALMYVQSQPLGGAGKSFQGEAYFTAENPPFGAVFTYFLKESYKTQKQKRQEAEREADRKGSAAPYPTYEQLKSEDAEEPPAIILTITDSSGQVVRRLSRPPAPGMNRIAWDLRYPATILPLGQGQGFGGGGGAPSGSLVMPGKYTVSIAKRVGGVLTPLSKPQSFNIVLDNQVSLPAPDRTVLVEFQRKVARLQRAIFGALNVSNEVRTRLGLIKRALQETPAAEYRLTEQATAMEKRINSLLDQLRGDSTLNSRNENSPLSINQRVQGIIGEQAMSTSKPTQTQIDQYNAAADEFKQVLAELRQLIEGDLERLEKALEAAGAPYTPGRLPEWKDN